MDGYWTYMMASSSGVLYVGITGRLVNRVWQHKFADLPGFTKRYNVKKLVWCERWPTPEEAIAREKELKGWRREKKVQLLEAANPDWKDLASDWSLGLPSDGSEEKL